VFEAGEGDIVDAASVGTRHIPGIGGIAAGEGIVVRGAANDIFEAANAIGIAPEDARCGASGDVDANRIDVIGVTESISANISEESSGENASGLKDKGVVAAAADQVLSIAKGDVGVELARVLP